MFQREDFYDVTIKDVRAAACKFDAPPPAFDLVFDLVGKDGTEDVYTLEVSNNVATGGKHQGEPRWQIAYGVLQTLGYDGRLIASEIRAALAGVACRCSVSATQKTKQDGSQATYYNVTWIGPAGAGGRTGEVMDLAAADALCLQMFPAYAQAAQPAVQPAQVAVQQQPAAAPVSAPAHHTAVPQAPAPAAAMPSPFA